MPTTLSILHVMLTLYLLATALPGAIKTQLPSKIKNLSFIYFGWSLVGQILALPLIFLSFASLCFAAFGPNPSLWIGLANAVSIAGFIAVLRQSWISSQTLSTLFPDGKGASLSRYLFGAAFPIQLGRRDVKRLKNIAYGSEGRRHLLDVYSPKAVSPTPMPILIHVHGGGWIVGNKHQQAQPLIQHMASQGWLVVDINYRLGPWARMPAMIQDVLRAVAWVKENAAAYNGDPKFVALTGGSAGGHLVALAALAPDVDAFKPGFREADCSVDACVPVYGLYDLLDKNQAMEAGAAEIKSFMNRFVMPQSSSGNTALWEQISPISHVGPNAPPMLLLHGQHDSLADLASARAFAETLSQASGNGVTFVELPGKQHAYDVAYSPPVPEHVRAVQRFLDKARGDKLHR